MRQLFLFIISSCIAIHCFASVEIDGIYYNLNSSTQTASVTKSKNYSYYGDINIPEKITYEDIEYLVTSIENEAFYNCNETSVTIPNSVTKIGNYVFDKCDYLQKITIPSSVNSIGKSCAKNVDIFIEDLTAWCYISFPDTYESPFSKWRLFLNNEEISIIEIPETLSYVHSSTFAGCTSIKEVTLPASIYNLGDYAFYNCTELEKINLNEGLYYFGKYCLCNCRKITELTLPKTAFKFEVGALQNLGIKSITIPSNVWLIDDGCFLNSEFLEEVIIEDGLKPITIGTGQYNNNPQFQNCTLKSLYLGRDIQKKENLLSFVSPFKEQKDLTDVTIGNCVTEIPTGCFEGCSNLVNISIPDNVQSIGAYAFDRCENLPIENSIRYADCYAIEVVDKTLESYEFKEGTRFFNSYLFASCSNLLSIDLPANIESISDGFFSGCENLTKIEIPENVKTIGSYAFYGCKSITEMFIPKSVNSIYSGAFGNCTSLSNLIIEDSDNSIGIDNSSYTGMFRDCPLQEVYIGRGIGITFFNGEYNHYPFSNQKQLKKLSFGVNCTGIREGFFYDCSGLEQIFVPWQNPSELARNSFSQTTYNNCSLYVPTNTLSVYSMTNYWNLFKKIEEYDSSALSSINDDPHEAIIYNLQGQPVKNIDKRGIYIINNKAVVF